MGTAVESAVLILLNQTVNPEVCPKRNKKIEQIRIIVMVFIWRSW
jgi:hypothetical protein